MQRKFTPNAVRVDGDIAYLELTNRNGDVVGEAIIDTEDLGRVLAAGRWYAQWHSLAQSYYVKRSHDRCLLHRFVMNADTQDDVDHIHHNTLDCRKAELRRCTHAENMQNRRGAHKNSKSGVRGVFWHKDKQRWRGQVVAYGRKHHIGYFDDLADAEAAVEEARRLLHRAIDG